MKKLFKLIKRYIGEAFIVIGGFLTVYNLLQYDHPFWSLRGGGVSYYYTDTAKILIALGVALIIIGILVIRRRKK